VACGGRSTTDGVGGSEGAGTGGTTVTGGTGGTLGGSGGTGGRGGTGAAAAAAGSAGVAGSSGSAVGGTSGSMTCPAIADCNWCNGSPVYDARGCVAGYRCANGADPCTTQPCTRSLDCAAGEICDFNGLCQPLPVSCSEECTGTLESCACLRKCSDGRVYEFSCGMDAAYQVKCRCTQDDQPSFDCGMGGGGGSACSMGPLCCGFPN
jgi:hypothetical protein